MSSPSSATSLEAFTTFGDLLKYLRRREHLTQRDISIAVGYSEAHISRLEQNERVPDVATITAVFVPALRLQQEPAMVARLLALASAAHLPGAQANELPPFKGLQHFDESDADLFFGREPLTAKLVGRLRENRFLAVVVGSSGSGKSSIVRAGILSALKRGEMLADGRLPPPGSASWPVHVITPTAHPLEALAVSLTRAAESVTATATLMDDLARDSRSLHLYVRKLLSHGADEQKNSSAGESRRDPAAHPRSPAPQRLVLVVDQFSELFTLCRSEAERKAFVDNLLTAVGPSAGGTGEGPTIVIITLRADFYAHCAQYANLREALMQQQEYIGPMTAADLRRAIEEPARRSGWDFEPGLIDLLLHDVGDEPGALPLLSHALLETWKRRQGRILTFKGYSESGGVRGAIARTAETVYQDFSAGQQSIARNIFLRLTELGAAETGMPSPDTRRRASLEELVPRLEDAPALSEAAQIVLETLAEARLITISEGTAEVAHEALIREWPTLRQWLQENREALRVHRHLTETARAWEALNRDVGELYRGARLAQAVEWAAARPGELNALERAFLEAAREWAERQAAEREALRQHELETAQKLAEFERRRAEEQSWAARLAFARELAAGALSHLTIDPELSILLALQAVKETTSVNQPVLPEAENALHRAVQASRVQFTLSGHTGPVNGVAISPDGKLLATSGADGTVKLWEAATGKLWLTLHEAGHTHSINAVAFSPDGSQLVTAGSDRTAKIWNISTALNPPSGQAWLTLSGHTGSVESVAFSPDGRLVATASADGTAKVWDVAAGQALLTLTGHAGDVVDVAFSPDGTRLGTASVDQTAKVWDISAALNPAPRRSTSGKEIATLSGHTRIVQAIAFSPDGKRIMTASWDCTVTVWDAASGQPLFALTNHTNAVLDAAFSSDGLLMATTSLDATAKVWDAASGKELLNLPGHTAGVLAVVFAPAGKHLVTASTDGTAKVWDITPGREWLTLAGHTDWVPRTAFSPDGQRLATASADKMVKVWDLATGQVLLALPVHNGRVHAVAFSSVDSGQRLATAGEDGVRVWDIEQGDGGLITKELLRRPGPTSGMVIRVFKGYLDVAFSPDGTRLAAAGADGLAKVWDISSELNPGIGSGPGAGISASQELFTLSGHTAGLTSLAFSPDGRYLATASEDKTARVWDAGTGKVLLIFSGHSMFLWAVAFSPDGQRLATASRDGTAKVWDLKTGEELLTLSGHIGTVFDVAFSPDGSQLATSSGDGTAKIWDANTGQELLTLYGHGKLVSSVAFSPDGARLATSSLDSTARIYLVRLEELVALARSRLTRTWRPDECVRLLHMTECPPSP